MPQINKKEINKIVSDIASRVRVTGDNHGLFSVSYLAVLAKEQKMVTVQELKTFIETKLPETRRLFLEDSMSSAYQALLQLAMDLSNQYDFDTLLAILKLTNSDNERLDFSTPDSINKLCVSLLEIRHTDDVADLGTGSGSFLLKAAEKQPKFMYGIDIDPRTVEMAKIRTEFFAKGSEIQCGNMFEIPRGRKFDKIFSNFPFGLRNLDIPDEELKHLDELIPGIAHDTRSEWLFIGLMLDHLKEYGMAVCLVPNGLMFNQSHGNLLARKELIDQGYVQAVIALPERMFSYIGVNFSLMLLSKRTNSSIQMINAQTLFTKERRLNIFSDRDIQAISTLLTTDSELSKSVPLEQIKKNDYQLVPSHYLIKPIENGKEFGLIIKNVIRGAQFKARELDQLVSKEPTRFQYLTLSEIHDNRISEHLPYIQEPESRYEQYEVKKHNLILSKIGKPFKVAVAENEVGTTVIGNGNLYIIEVDEDQVNPYYLKAYLETPQGQDALSNQAVNVHFLNLSISSLKKLIIPVPPMEEQEKIANRYKAKETEIELLEMKLEKAKAELREIFE